MNDDIELPYHGVLFYSENLGELMLADEEKIERIARQYAESYALVAVRLDRAKRDAELATLRKENDTLRGLLGSSAKPCVYCGLAAEDQAKCESGFPGCARADDQALRRDAFDTYRADMNEKELVALRNVLEAARNIYAKARQEFGEYQHSNDDCWGYLADSIQAVEELNEME